MTNYATGHGAEQSAVEYLKAQDYKILDINWRTKYCEIDVIARKNQTVYLIEVKYRKSSVHGSGLEYITPKKLSRMKFAAEMWVNHCGWKGDYRLAAIELSGDKEVIEFLVDL